MRGAQIAIVAVATCFVAMTLLVFLAGGKAKNPTRLAPALELPGLDGTVYRLSDRRGNWVLLNFWATWCPPCVEETPDLIALATRFKGRLEVVGISVDDERATIAAFAREHRITYLILHDVAAKTAHRYGTFKYPETFLVDPGGRIVRHWIGQVEWAGAAVLSEIDALIAAR